jgi:alkylresorcinol/alkylpyrone synthase
MLKTARAIRTSHGLKVAFDVESPELPQLLRQHPKPAVQDFLDASGMSLGEFNGFLFHPGGDFGNMSSPTALFALDQSLKAGATGPHLMAAFGHGFSAYFLTVDL